MTRYHLISKAGEGVLESGSGRPLKRKAATTPWAANGQRSIVQLGGGINMLHLEYRSLLEFK